MKPRSSQQAEADPVVPEQLQQTAAAPTERIHGPAERVLGQHLLHHHGEAVHALALMWSST